MFIWNNIVFKEVCMHLRVPKTYYIDILQIYGYIESNILKRSLYTFTCTKNILYRHNTNIWLYKIK